MAVFRPSRRRIFSRLRRGSRRGWRRLLPCGSDRVLEPSAGTGALLGAITAVQPAAVCTAVEMDGVLARRLCERFPGVRHADFLACNDLGRFDRIVMNSPFDHGADVEHIEHAFRMLAPGGILVAICANGPRQVAALSPKVRACGGLWEELPPRTFPGTNVRSVLLTIQASL